VAAALGRGGWRVLLGWRLFVTLPLAILSLYLIRGIPFFAVAAAPVLALNVLDFRSRRTESVERADRRLALAGRLLALVAVVAALVAAVPGWLQGEPQIYRVGWRVQPDPSWRRAAETIHDWQRQNLVPAETHWFNLSPEAGNYLACYAPGQRAFFDSRFALSAQAADDLRVVRRSLMAEDASAEPGRTDRSGEPAWRRALRAQLKKEGPRFLIVPTENVNEATLTMLARLVGDSDEWVPCYLDGRAGIFAWQDPSRQSADPGPPAAGGRDTLAQLRWDFEKRAFGPQADKAPEEAPERAAQQPSWWSRLWAPPPPASSQGDLAVLCHIRFATRKRSYQSRNTLDWVATVGAWNVGTAAAPGGPILNGSWLPAQVGSSFQGRVLEGRAPDAYWPLADALMFLFASTQDSGPPDALYLWIRAARQALAVNPQDARAHLLLGRGYFTLWRETREHVLTRQLSRLAEIRQAQIIGALEAALKYGLPPGQPQEAHLMLAEVYATGAPPAYQELIARAKQRRGGGRYLPVTSGAPLYYLDLTAKHLRQWLQLTAAAPPPGQDAQAFARMIDDFSRDLDRLDKEVKFRQDQYVNNNVSTKPLQKVDFALRSGLAETALQVILNDPEWRKAFEDDRTRAAAGNRMLDVLLNTGRLEEVREFLGAGRAAANSEQFAALYRLALVRYAAVLGDYARADRYLAEVLPAGKPPGERAREAAASLVGGFLLRQAPEAAGLLGQVERQFPASATPQRELVPDPLRNWQGVAVQASNAVLQLMYPESELYLLRGWLTLEAGQTDEADKYLSVAASLRPPERWQPFPTQELAARCRGWLARARQ
jgi:hypothetical protein